MLTYLDNKNEVWIRDCYACAHPDYRINIRVINENPSANLFAYNMFLRPTEDELENFIPEMGQLIQAPNFKANPAIDGTRQENFVIVFFRS
jgi:phosphoenolpyruvate carboxykinase (ATP)